MFPNVSEAWVKNTLISLMIDIYYELINEESNNKAHCRSSLIAPWILNKMLL